MNLLEVHNLQVQDTISGKLLVKGSSFSVGDGNCLAIVGESGSGKSVTSKAIMRLNKPVLQTKGSVLFKGEELTRLSDKEMRRRRGKSICMIMQNGMSAFNPTSVIGVHLRETLSMHLGVTKSQADAKMIPALERVMIKNPSDLLAKYPHQLSGGMLQRVMIALAIVLEPDLIIADEPTTALDTISQYEVVEEFKKLRERLGTSMIFISHDLGVVQRIAENVIVMKDGAIVESGTTQKIFNDASHPYTKYLVATRLSLSNHFKKIMEGSSCY
ncbi:ABC transporter ATP-binding protein [Sutcliffiella horikoshii]|uniref:staphylopine uptake ABC transporter ATP-binding protein CntD n=1 Tax=Sutcliffiella horikoshii TaxID=79883 RepID=UPI00203F9D59|nr:ABC transporter ATP-binding protein [Sutcliffiella horikoshii]MCM3618314.1 ABC transporter ATP-binding protein [Sutcliffiella horikoshii]